MHLNEENMFFKAKLSKISGTYIANHRKGTLHLLMNNHQKGCWE